MNTIKPVDVVNKFTATAGGERQHPARRICGSALVRGVETRTACVGIYVCGCRARNV